KLSAWRFCFYAFLNQKLKHLWLIVLLVKLEKKQPSCKLFLGQKKMQKGVYLKYPLQTPITQFISGIAS
ncbi:MAG: hypothetical protein RL045_1732, partial [Bacteroidota bacterium]